MGRHYDCAQVIIVSSGFSRYRDHSPQVMAICMNYRRLSSSFPLMKPSWMSQICRMMLNRSAVRCNSASFRVGLPCSIGAASNKLLAKIGNDISKSDIKSPRPLFNLGCSDGGEEASGAAAGRRDVGRWSQNRGADDGTWSEYHWRPGCCREKELVRLFGKNGYDLAQRARHDKRESLQNMRSSHKVRRRHLPGRDGREGSARTY